MPVSKKRKIKKPQPRRTSWVMGGTIVSADTPITRAQAEAIQAAGLAQLAIQADGIEFGRQIEEERPDSAAFLEYVQEMKADLRKGALL